MTGQRKSVAHAEDKRKSNRKQRKREDDNPTTPKQKRTKRKSKNEQTPEEQERAKLRKNLSEVLIPYVDEDLCASGTNKYFPIKDEGTLLILENWVNFVLG